MDLINSHKKYKTTPTMVYSCQYHVIFTTKYRRKVLTEPIQERAKQLVLEKQNDYEYELLEMEVMSDHVHLLIDVCPQKGIYKTVGLIKGHLSNILRTEFKELKTKLPTLWTRSKFISSVGSVSLETVKKYIEEQKHV